MKTFVPLIAALALLPVVLAAEVEKPSAASAENPVAAPGESKPFTIFHITKTCPVNLDDEYGVMLINTGGEINPSPRFLIAIRKSRTLIETADAGVAARTLKIIPKGSKLRWYDSCTIPRSYGLKESVRNNFHAVIKNAGLVLLEHHHLTCYCEKNP